MRDIGGWFQGTGSCVGDQPIRWGTWPIGNCLMMACESEAEVAALDAIVTTLFPERACKCQTSPRRRLVHFNNHPDTTRDQVDKILHTYHMEVGE